MNNSTIKEELSIVYLSAICASAGASFDRQIHDDDSTDAIIKKRLVLSDGRSWESSLRVQLKSTSSNSLYRESDVSIFYDLKVKNYNDLKTNATTPIILALLILPDEPDNWVNWSKEELILRGRMFWKSFHSEPDTPNRNTITIEISKSNYINSETLLDLLNKVATEELI